MKYIVTLNGKNYEVIVDECEARVVSVSDAAAVAPAPVPAAAPTPAAAPSAASAASSDAVCCPMPGTVYSIKKRVGDTVKKGEPVVVLEAMKMENDIPAAADGVVKAIYVSEGQSVSTGDPLFLVG